MSNTLHAIQMNSYYHKVIFSYYHGIVISLTTCFYKNSQTLHFLQQLHLLSMNGHILHIQEILSHLNNLCLNHWVIIWDMILYNYWNIIAITLITYAISNEKRQFCDISIIVWNDLCSVQFVSLFCHLLMFHFSRLLMNLNMSDCVFILTN